MPTHTEAAGWLFRNTCYHRICNPSTDKEYKSEDYYYSAFLVPVTPLGDTGVLEGRARFCIIALVVRNASFCINLAILEQANVRGPPRICRLDYTFICFPICCLATHTHAASYTLRAQRPFLGRTTCAASDEPQVSFCRVGEADPSSVSGRLPPRTLLDLLTCLASPRSASWEGM